MTCISKVASKSFKRHHYALLMLGSAVATGVCSPVFAQALGTPPVRSPTDENGVDLATAAPYEALVKRMNGIMDQIEAILDEQKAG